jgi:hypothetical protein
LWIWRIKGFLWQVERADALKAGSELPDIPDGERCLHLQARGGRGKSFVCSALIAKALSLGLVVQVSSFSGVSALLLPRGTTAHRTYGLPLQVATAAPSTLTTRSAQGQRLAHCAVHFIDEIESLHRLLFECASDVSTRCAMDVFDRDDAALKKSFAGAMVVVVGDRHQTTPVIKSRIMNDQIIMDSLVRSSDLYLAFKQCELTIAQRTLGNLEFDSWLGRVSVNTAPGPLPLLADQLPPTQRKIFIPQQCFSTDNMIGALEFLFGPVPLASPFPRLNPRHAVISALNRTVDEFNAAVLEQWVEGEVIELRAAHKQHSDSAGAPSQNFTTTEYMESCEEQGVPNALLHLKKGCVMVLVRNLLQSHGLTNGSRLILLSDAPEVGKTLNVLHVETVPTRPNEPPQRHFIPRIAFSMASAGGAQFTRYAFPIKLAYAITSHRSQGSTLDRVLYCVRTAPFSHGQAYVSISRGRSFQTLGFLHDKLDDGEKPTFVNYVLQQLLTPGPVSISVPRHLRGGAIGEEVSDADDDGIPLQPAPKSKRRRTLDVNSPGVFQKGAMSLHERRLDTYNMVVDAYEY